ncbi:amidase domain-containing protein [Cohnella sp. GCM10020058]|uniref:amidase domain-containing protein n=1 Tax=Cohnella sp. GCM10020058 TaxID=3317330 RepID=UPI003640087D
MPELDERIKKALVEYVNAVNEADLNRSPEALAQVGDEAHRWRLQRRTRALRRRDAASAARPRRGEIRARVLRWSAGEKEAYVDLQLQIARACGTGAAAYAEERIERERIRLVPFGGEWRLDRAEPLGDERSSAALLGSGAEGAFGAASEWPVAPSVPFIPARDGYGAWQGIASGGVQAAPWANPYGGTPARSGPYDREAVVAYAEAWWDKANPAYELFEVNCTNYVSQCLFAGGAPMNYTGKRESGWWYHGLSGGQERWSYSWAVANSLQHFLSQPRPAGLRALRVERPEQLSPGDVICYDWDGNGQFRHNTIVTAADGDGMPLVNANTVPSRHRYWDYRDSYAWTENTRYRFYHIEAIF